jgi:hypothetical protein
MLLLLLLFVVVVVVAGLLLLLLLLLLLPLVVVAAPAPKGESKQLQTIKLSELDERAPACSPTIAYICQVLLHPSVHLSSHQ